MGFGEYPADYNPKVHGPYDPARFYGKREYNSCTMHQYRRKFYYHSDMRLKDIT